jgi:hypothetical protein
MGASTRVFARVVLVAGLAGMISVGADIDVRARAQVPPVDKVGGCLSLLLQVQGERDRRVLAMVNRMNEEGFGSCSRDGEWEAVWPKEISIQDIAGTNREQVCRTLGPRDVLRDLGYRFA